MNQAYGGWNIDINHIFFANGRRAYFIPPCLAPYLLQLTVDLIGDPWREATVSAESSPYTASAARPVGFSDGFHCSDLSTANANVDPTVAAVQKQALAAIKTWLAEFKPASKAHGKTTRFERE